MISKTSQSRKSRLQKKVRSRIRSADNSWLRLSVYRSNKHIYAQVIDDQLHKSVTAINDKKLNKDTLTKTEKAKQTGLALAESLKTMKINQVVFDRGHYKYGGRVKALVEGVREGGITI